MTYLPNRVYARFRHAQPKKPIVILLHQYSTNFQKRYLQGETFIYIPGRHSIFTRPAAGVTSNCVNAWIPVSIRHTFKTRNSKSAKQFVTDGTQQLQVKH